jgi:hypothetical protein
MSSKTRKPSSQWAAQFLVAAELERHGYNVAFTMGNCTPVADLMAGLPGADPFWVDVKGVWGKNSWNGDKKSARPKLFYILVSVSESRGGKDKFFILDQNEFNSLVDEYTRKNPDTTMPGFNWNDGLQFEDKWGKLPGWGAPSA